MCAVQGGIKTKFIKMRFYDPNENGHGKFERGQGGKAPHAGYLILIR